jgi:hemerythrin-like domain-containing protein
VGEAKRMEGNMNSATKILRAEHDTILEMLDALESVVRRLEQRDSVSLELMTGFQEFFSLFADRCHHGKEEDLLFPLLERKGVPRSGGPLGCMLAEHDQGRGYVQRMSKNAPGCASGDASARKFWTEAARAYANLLRSHIWKENEILFQMAERLLSADEQTLLANKFVKVEEQKMGAGTHARLHQKMEGLLRDLATSASR